MRNENLIRLIARSFRQVHWAGSSVSISMLALFCLGLGAPARADIVGGEDIAPNDAFKSSIVALYKETPRGGMLCSATLIAKNYAVTAAHCVEAGTDGMVVIFGKKISSKDRELVRVSDAEMAREWKVQHLTDHDLGDIAVVKLDGKLPRGYHPAKVAPAKLKLAKGEQVLLAGYGISNAMKHTGAGELRKTEVTIADPEFGKTEMIFDQSHGSGACHGDSGGPAFIENRGKFYLLGVTNRGYPSSAPDDCAHEVVYTKVAAYKAWISQVMKEMDRSK